MEKQKWLLIFIATLIIIVIIVGVILIVFKDRIFTGGKYLGDKSQEELSNKGYGTFSETYRSPCITSNGKCNTAGVKYITQYCQPHPITGKGCINDKGEQTFNSQSTQEVCQPNCRAFILNEITLPTNTCQYDTPYNEPAYTCVPSNAQMYEYRTYSCIKNDSIGDNTCTYQCGNAGITSAGIPGDQDPSKLSYIPKCASNPNATITLNSFNWGSINNIASDVNKGVLSKGYKITNITTEIGEVNPNLFRISPPYPPWSDNPSSYITYEQLRELDSQFITYQNCTTAVQKPSCDNWDYIRPTSIGSDTTLQSNSVLCGLDSNFVPMNQCYYHPWYNISGEVPGSSGLNFINPYTGGASGPDTIGATGAVYSWMGIGNYGYFYTPLTCNAPQNLTPSGQTGQYLIPPGASGSVCINLNAPPKQCSNNLTNMFSTTPSQNLQTLIKDFDNGDYNPQIATSYPQPVGSTNYICSTTYTNGVVVPTPGCVQTCQYRPEYNNIDFNQADMNGNYIDINIQKIIGKYVNLNIELSGDKYFLGTQNVPCKNNSNLNVPLGNCLGGTGTSYLPSPCSFIYNGGTGINAGNFWSKNGCDSESIEMASRMLIMVSANSVSGVIGSGSTGTQILCDLYANINGKFGYLSTTNISTSLTVPDLNINPYLYNYGDVGNIVANNQLSSSTSSLYFNALDLGQEIPSNVNNGVPQFIISYNDSTKIYSVSSSSGLISSIDIDTYNGSVYTPNVIQFQFTDELNKIANVPYFITQGFSEPYIKTEGIYTGDDVTRTITLQRNTQCYSKNLCQNGFPSDVCYNTTCNLYYKYNTEICG